VLILCALSNQAFKNCTTGDFNLSQESLTSPAMTDILMSLSDTDPNFFVELSKDPRKVQPLDPKLSWQGGSTFIDNTTPDPAILGLDGAEPAFPPVDDDDENISTADIITHVIEGKHPSHYLERDGQLVRVVTEAEHADNLPNNELEEAGPTSNSESGSGSDFEEPEDDKQSLLFPTVTQGRSVRVRKPRNLSHLNRFWNDY
jgi:hypothetical protein